MPDRYEVAAYYFPNYHPDPRNRTVHGSGWTEWELVRAARPRFPGHRQPRTPVWGFKDESDPTVFAVKIDAAADHGVSALIFDWYWYDDGPFLLGALDRGYLQAGNNRRVKFALMWANHDWTDIHPAALRGPQRLLYPGAVTEPTFEVMTDQVVQRYFAHPAYWRVAGRAYFSIYELRTFVRGLGGVPAARRALERFRDKAADTGGVHLNAVAWGVPGVSENPSADEPGALLRTLGFDSVTSYVWVHHLRMETFPVWDYDAAAEQAEETWRLLAGRYPVPYFPNVTVGWDSTPRCRQADPLVNAAYPFGPVLAGNTPLRFRHALARAKAFLDRGDAPPILTLNAWNEWTEGSYLEPDTVHGMGYLQAVREVFGGPPR